MSERLSRFDPLPAAPMVGAAATIALAALTPRYSLRGDAAELQPLTSIRLPEKIGDWRMNGAELALKLGPDEWLLLGEVAQSPDALNSSVTEITERQLGISIDGPASAAIVMAGCPLDLATMPAGRGTRTIYETVEIVVIKHSDTRFQIEVWRSFAPWLWAALATAAANCERA